MKGSMIVQEIFVRSGSKERMNFREEAYLVQLRRLMLDESVLMTQKVGMICVVYTDYDDYRVS